MSFFTEKGQVFFSQLIGFQSKTLLLLPINKKCSMRIHTCIIIISNQFYTKVIILRYYKYVNNERFYDYKVRLLMSTSLTAPLLRRLQAPSIRSMQKFFLGDICANSLLFIMIPVWVMMSLLMAK